MNRTEKSSFVSLLKAERIQRGWTQKHVATQIEAPYPYMISRWENRVVTPNRIYRHRLCNLYKQEESILFPLHSRSLYEILLSKFMRGGDSNVMLSLLEQDCGFQQLICRCSLLKLTGGEFQTVVTSEVLEVLKDLLTMTSTLIQSGGCKRYSCVKHEQATH